MPLKQGYSAKTIGKNIGYVYLITNKLTNRRYIGKKLFWFSKTRTIKGKKKKEKALSDWQEYWSSSEELQEDVNQLGKENFTREIIHLCQTKGNTNYLEAKEQFIQGVLEDKDAWYNAWIMIKVRRSHLKF